MAMNAASIHALLQGMLAKPPQHDLSTDDLNLELPALGRLDNEVLQVGADIEKIQKDNSLSPDGQRKAIATIGTKAAPIFNWLPRMRDAVVTAYNEKTHTLIAPLTDVPKSLDPVADFLRGQEIRTTIGKTGAVPVFLTACETDDLETTRALLTAPGQPWISADLRQRGEETFAERTNPALYAVRTSKGLLRDDFHMLVGTIRDWLLSLGTDKAAAQAIILGK